MTRTSSRSTSPVLAAVLLASMLRRARTCSAASCASSVTSGHDRLITGWIILGPPASRPGVLAFEDRRTLPTARMLGAMFKQHSVMPALVAGIHVFLSDREARRG